LKIGATQPLQATAKDSSGVKIEGATFSWSSSDSSIASVDGSGLVTALQAGQATITASADTVTSAPVSVTVDPPQPPTAVLIPSTRQGSVPLSIRFNGMGSSDPDGIVTAYVWDFGDGSAPGSASIVDHLYQTEGSYVVTLKVTDNSGRTGTATTTINAVPPVPPGNCTPAATTGWERVNSPAIGDMWGIYFVNPCEGWSVGMEMALAHTTDSGKTWTKQDNIHWNGTVPEVPPDIYDVFFLDKNTGWAAGWPELILFTTDGGLTWNEQRLNRAYTTEANYCGIWDSTHTVCTKKNGVYLRRVRFADPQNGWTVGRFGYIFKTNNGGATWQDNVVVPNPVDCAANPVRKIGEKYTPHWFGLDVQSAAEIWIAGGSDDGAWCTGWNRVIIHTLDGGATWLYRNDHPDFGALPGSGRFQDLHLIGDNGWAVGEIGTILRTLDHGATWSRVTGTGAGGATLWGLSFTDPMNVWITGTNGALVHSPDGGASWCKQESGTGTQLRRSSFLDPNFGWIAGQGKIFRTTAGGKPQPTCASP
ncbi:MAG TPA: YCF48-related protein, partial [Candidatus Manganitrophaceae bacterium]|nr:YCF48-related protein [Candidatus Manganitrophaceae bacterium]